MSVSSSEDRSRPRGRDRAAVGGDHVEPARVQEGGQPAAEQAAGARDEDAQEAQPTITAPPFTESTCPCM